MQYLLLVYIDPTLTEAVGEPEYAARMRHCIEHADELRSEGTLLASRQLEPPATARAVRVRDGRIAITDGPFAETKEILAGFNLVEAESLEAAVALAIEIPWARTGCIEVRAVRDMEIVRRQVGAAAATVRLDGAID